MHILFNFCCYLAFLVKYLDILVTNDVFKGRTPTAELMTGSWHGGTSGAFLLFGMAAAVTASTFVRLVILRFSVFQGPTTPFLRWLYVR